MYVGIIIIERDGTRVKWVRDEEFRAHDMFRFLSDRGDEVIATFDAILHYGSVVEAIAQMSGRPASGYELLRSGTETVSPKDYNELVAKVTDALNPARPIAAGGTGASKSYAGPTLREVELDYPNEGYKKYEGARTIAPSEIDTFHDNEFTFRAESAFDKGDSPKPFFPSKIGRIDKLPRF